MYSHPPFPKDDSSACSGILLTNLGTPDSTQVADVRRYLKEFLSDSRVVELPRLLWWSILNGIILRTRPKRSAAAYEKVWTPEGSPLLTSSRQIASQLETTLRNSGKQAKVVLAMRYGSPSIADGLETLRQANARRILVLPLYPQYSATTTASTFDKITQELKQWRWLPELRFINDYHQDPEYISALEESVRRCWADEGVPEKLLISFHGIPQSYTDGGDPYPRQCATTAQQLADALNLKSDQWQLSFQSRMGNKPWIQPYTDETLKSWATGGIKRVDVICPGFPADCLETLEEIGEENRAYFLQAGGEHYRYIPALNNDQSHINALSRIASEHLW